jgi:hypothetical protein
MKAKFIARDTSGAPVADAEVHAVFRAGGLIPWDTGIQDTMTDSDGVGYFDIPLLTDHANVTVVKGAFISPEQKIDFPAKFLADLSNPLLGALQGTLPIDIPVKINALEYDPIAVGSYRTGNVVKKATDWLSKSVINIIMLVVFAVVLIVIIKYFWGNVTGVINKGYKFAKEVRSKVV